MKIRYIYKDGHRLPRTPRVGIASIVGFLEQWEDLNGEGKLFDKDGNFKVDPTPTKPKNQHLIP